jgi:crotonobetainyl-CoA:carnitine CoA-transferase CaiB-like acyl-CoA transferase
VARIRNVLRSSRRIMLDGKPLKVMDLGVGMAAALVSKTMAMAGSKVRRLDPVGGDPFYDVYPAYRVWRECTVPIERGDLSQQLADADVCIVGGEDYPGLPEPVNVGELTRQYPRLVILKLSGYVEGFAPGAPAVDLLVQARSGLVNEQYADRPLCFSLPVPTYGAALLGLAGVWAALLERQRSGLGQVVFASLQQGIALFWTPIWMSAERPDDDFMKVSPKGVRHLIFQCGDGGYVQFVMGIPGAVAKLYQVLGIDAPVDQNDRGNPRPGAALDKYFGDLGLIAPYVRKRERGELLQALWKAGIAAEPVLNPGEAWDDEQVRANSVIVRNEGGWRFVGQPLNIRVIDCRAAPPGERVSSASAPAAPLAGVRIVDLGSFVAGPFASKVLANLGADVIKVEPLTGSAGRGILRHTIAADGAKRSIAVDLKTPEGLEIVEKLCARAHAVQHNFRVGVAKRLGVDPASLRRVKADLVSLETTAYGAVGPKAAHSGFDMVMQAFCGHEARAGGAGNPPLWCRVPLVDYGTGAMGSIALLIGLVIQGASGSAVETHVSLLDTALFLMSELVQSPDGAFAGAPLLDKGQTGFHPAESLYETKDGWIAVVARTNHAAQGLARIGQLIDPRPRGAWGELERMQIATHLRRYDTDCLLQELSEAGVWAERCVEDGWAALRKNAAAHAAQMVVGRQDRRRGRIEGCLGPLVSFSRSAVTVEGLAAPELGEHTDEVLLELGYTPGEIADLRRRAVVA